MERGVFDIEAMQKANDDLIATIEDSLRIADEGKAKRAEAEQSLIKMEGDLKRRARLGQGRRPTGMGDSVGRQRLTGPDGGRLRVDASPAPRALGRGGRRLGARSPARRRGRRRSREASTSGRRGGAARRRAPPATSAAGRRDAEASSTPRSRAS